MKYFILIKLVNKIRLRKRVPINKEVSAIKNKKNEFNNLIIVDYKDFFEHKTEFDLNEKLKPNTDDLKFFLNKTLKSNIDPGEIEKWSFV